MAADEETSADKAAATTLVGVAVVVPVVVGVVFVFAVVVAVLVLSTGGDGWPLGSWPVFCFFATGPCGGDEDGGATTTRSTSTSTSTSATAS